MIRVDALTKRYGPKTVVDDLSFEVHPGVVTGFLGPNGSGKSTTMRLIMGLDLADAGTATLNGKPIGDYPQAMSTVGVLLDASYLHPTRSAADHLRVQAASNGIGRRRVDEVLTMVGLSDAAHRRVGEFSLGMKQRLGLAGALLGDPEILILDEPANGLDPEGVHWIRQILSRLAGEGRTVFVSSHLLSEMALIAHDIVIIGEGALIARTTVADLTAAASGASVRVRSPQAAALAQLISADGGTSRADADSLTVTGLTVEDIGRLAHRHRIELHELTSHTPTLEAAFLELTASAQEYRTASDDGSPR